MVSRGTVAAFAPPASIIDSTSATSMTVTASASTSVPKGSPTLCAITSAWCTALVTASTSAGTATSNSAVCAGSRRPAASTPTAKRGKITNRSMNPLWGLRLSDKMAAGR